MKRPTPLQWLRYAYGGRLPADLWPWVLRDVTDRGWSMRHVARAAAQMTPLSTAILIFVPGPFWIRALSVLGGAIMGLFFSLGFMIETTEHRLVKAGYPVGTGERIRQHEALERRRIATARRREKLETRMSRRSAR